MKKCPNCGEQYSGPWCSNCGANRRRRVTRGSTVIRPDNRSISRPSSVIDPLERIGAQPGDILQRTTYKCGNCGFPSESKAAVQTHIDRHHPHKLMANGRPDPHYRPPRILTQTTRHEVGGGAAFGRALRPTQQQEKELQEQNLIVYGHQKAVATKGQKSFEAWCTNCARMHSAVNKNGTPNRTFTAHMDRGFLRIPQAHRIAAQTVTPAPKTENAGRTEYGKLLKNHQRAQLEGVHVELSRFPGLQAGIHGGIAWRDLDPEHKKQVQWEIQQIARNPGRHGFLTGVAAERRQRANKGSFVIAGQVQPAQAEIHLPPPVKLETPLKPGPLHAAPGQMVTPDGLRKLRRDAKAGRLPHETQAQKDQAKWLRSVEAQRAIERLERGEHSGDIPGLGILLPGKAGIRDVLGAPDAPIRWAPEEGHRVNPAWDRIRTPPDIAEPLARQSNEWGCRRCGLLKPKSEFPDGPKGVCHQCVEEIESTSKERTVRKSKFVPGRGRVEYEEIVPPTVTQRDKNFLSNTRRQVTLMDSPQFRNVSKAVKKAKGRKSGR